MTRILVTGIGCISAIGAGIDATKRSIIEQRSGIGKLSLFESIHRDTIPVGQVKLTDRELREAILPRGNALFSRTALLGIWAVKEALMKAGIKGDPGIRTGLVSANTTGGMLHTERYFALGRKGRLRDLMVHECGESTERIANETGITGFITTVSTACSSSANAILLGARLIKAGIVDRVIAGGCDSLCKFTLNGFLSLLILDKAGCRPFDRDRQGTVLGEGAGYLVLESEASARASKKKALCELRGYANTCDAYHQTASPPDGEGAYRTMQKALENAGFEPGDIDYINAHGTGTPQNDLSEARAIERLFSPNTPAVSSTKGLTGHTLGAAGAIESVFSVLAITEGFLPPNAGFSEKIDEISFAPVTGKRIKKSVRAVVKNTFGFGGNNTTLIFSRC